MLSFDTEYKNLIKKISLVAVFLIFAAFYNSVKAQYCMAATSSTTIFPSTCALWLPRKSVPFAGLIWSA
jgi:hypothetical protein